ncbi:MAG: UDP-4-amino-4,6-dideoxy-N-acetyl-beta-L-altrosamine transaminase [Candidatus Omnitrophota bacterium]
MELIPYGHQSIGESDINAIVEALRSGWITQGPKVDEFEKALCEYTGAKYAVAVSSGTAALHLACLAAGVREGDEVITSPITFVATANSVLYCHGKPVFADVDINSGNINPEEIKKNITSKTRALIPVHFAGHPCDLKEISRIAKEHHLTIIEDAAHALGAEYQGAKTGSCQYSDMTVFSFHPVKSITTGEGGAITTNNKEFYEKLIMLRQHGITKDRSLLDPRRAESEGGWYHEMQQLGFNYRITDLQCALGISQLKRIDEFITKRRRIAEIYLDAFCGNLAFSVLKEGADSLSAWHLFPVILKDKGRRGMVFERLRERGIGVQVHYIPVYLQPYYEQSGYRKGTCPEAEDFYEREISIPLFYDLNDERQQYVIRNINEVIK